MKRCGTQMQCSATVAQEEWHLKRCKLVDRLSELQDDILVSILSRLKLKEAARTSVLSRRWGDLWTYTTGTLDFHYSDYSHYDDNEASKIILSAYLSGGRCSTGKPPLVERPGFVKWMDYVLSSHQGSTIDTFEVSTMLFGRIRKKVIDGWVEFALRKRVKTLKLEFPGIIPFPRGNYSLKLSLLCNSCIELASLKVLHLNKVDVTNEVIDYVLLKCRFLEELHVEQSYSLVELKVCGPLPQLKCLKILGCRKLKYLEINAINVVSFAFDGHPIPVTFKKAPLLIEASLGGMYASHFVENIGQFSSYLSRVESLMLELSCNIFLRDEVLPELPNFGNLRELELILKGFSVDGAIKCCASFLNKCPMLERFSLKAAVAGHRKNGRIKRSSLCLHSSLRLLEFTNFNGSDKEAKIYCCIACSLPSLTQVKLRPFSRKCFDNSKIKEKLVKLSKHLKQIIPPGAELTIQPDAIVSS